MEMKKRGHVEKKEEKGREKRSRGILRHQR